MIEICIKHQIPAGSESRLLTIDAEIEEGSLVHISGPSGIGKTTFFKILSGLFIPDFSFIKTGKAVLSDTENRIFLSPQKRNISLMFQQYALFPNMDIKQNIAFAQKKRNDESIDYFLERFNLKSVEKTFPSRLSGGQQQRVALVRALVQEADLILLDEPFSAVDRAMRDVMKQEIVKVGQQRRATVFVISHDENEFQDIRHVKLIIR